MGPLSKSSALLFLSHNANRVTCAPAGEDFEERVGSAAEGSPDHLRNGLWAASQLISTGSARANKRLLIFTRDENPAGSGPKAESHRWPASPSPADLHIVN